MMVEAVGALVAPRTVLAPSAYSARVRVRVCSAKVRVRVCSSRVRIKVRVRARVWARVN